MIKGDHDENINLLAAKAITDRYNITIGGNVISR